MQFSSIPGATELKTKLVEAAKHNHVAHAQLFLGREGGANLPLALAFATYLNCTDKSDTDSCGKCPSCIKYSKLIHPDLHFVFPTTTTNRLKKREDAISQNLMKEWREYLPTNIYGGLKDWAGFMGSDNKQPIISKEESRSIVKALSLKAYEGGFKTMIIWYPELMNPFAANAILKFLEEPPPKTIFLLVCNNANSLLTTILSRTQMLQVPQFSDEEVASYLVGKYGVDSKKANQAAFLSEGNIAEALRAVDDIHDDSEELFKHWMRSCFQRDYRKMLSLSADFASLPKEGQKSLLRYSLHICRESLLSKFSVDSLVRLTDEELGFVQKFSSVLDGDKLAAMTEGFTDALRHLERNANAKILFSNLSIKLAFTLK